MDNPAHGDAESPLIRLVALRSRRRFRTFSTLGLVVLGPVLAIATFLVLGPFDQDADTPSLRLILLADMIYVIIVAALVLYRVAKMIAARRAHSAGSRLHLRLTGVFALIALLPTVLVAVFATITVNLGLESWFSDRVRNALGHSLEAAYAYQEEHRADLSEDARALAGFLNVSRRASPLLSDGDLRDLLQQGQLAIQRGLQEAFVINGVGEIRARGERSYLFDYDRPSDEDLGAATGGDPIIIEDRDANEFRALMRLTAFPDRYLFVSREVDGQIISLLDETQETVRLYRQLEAERGQFLFQFGLIYIGFAVILILAAIWLGLWFAERLSRSVGRLASAAQRVGIGDLDVRVPEESGEDEIALLGRLFNQMTRQLKGQRDALIDQNERTEARRRQFDSVLTSVTSGVIGLNAEGQIDFMNRSAKDHLDLSDDRDQSVAIAAAVPEFAPLFDRLRGRGVRVMQDEVKVTRKGRLESLLVRLSVRRTKDGALEGYVVAFDDVTDLVSAQRMAAWGDVARRIAHEIKNPLTPIQLSAERVRRKFGKMLEEADAEQLGQLTDVIVRQTNDLRRIVDEFSKFARMPEPERQPEDVAKLLTDAVVLQQSGQPGTRIEMDIPAGPVRADLDATMIGQALTNLIKNGGEAIESLQKKGAPEGHEPQIRVAMALRPETVEIRISDNGIGLPPDRARLFEPYVTTRDEGTGLGLPIVKKIIEEHGGSLDLIDAEPFEEGAHAGAMARVILPRLAGEEGESLDE